MVRRDCEDFLIIYIRPHLEYTGCFHTRRIYSVWKVSNGL